MRINPERLLKDREIIEKNKREAKNRRMLPEKSRKKLREIQQK